MRNLTKKEKEIILDYKLGLSVEELCAIYQMPSQAIFAILKYNHLIKEKNNKKNGKKKYEKQN